MDKALYSAQSVAAALNKVKCYLTKEDLLHLINALHQSKLYYAQELWLHPSLLVVLWRPLAAALYNSTGRVFGLVSRDDPFARRYHETRIRTPKYKSKESTCFKLLLYHNKIPESESLLIQIHWLRNLRNPRLIFTKTNSNQVWLFLLSNRSNAKCCYFWITQWVWLDRSKPDVKRVLKTRITWHQHHDLLMGYT